LTEPRCFDLDAQRNIDPALGASLDLHRGDAQRFFVQGLTAGAVKS